MSHISIVSLQNHSKLEGLSEGALGDVGVQNTSACCVCQS